MRLPSNLENKSSKKVKEEIFCIWLKKESLIAIKKSKDKKLTSRHTLLEMLLESLPFSIMLQELLPSTPKLMENSLFLIETLLVLL